MEKIPHSGWQAKHTDWSVDSQSIAKSIYVNNRNDNFSVLYCCNFCPNYLAFLLPLSIFLYVHFVSPDICPIWYLSITRINTISCAHSTSQVAYSHCKFFCILTYAKRNVHSLGRLILYMHNMHLLFCKHALFWSVHVKMYIAFTFCHGKVYNYMLAPGKCWKQWDGVWQEPTLKQQWLI